MIEKKQKHLTYEDRLIIQAGLESGLKATEIAQEVGKDPSTISKEIKRNRFCTTPSKPDKITPCIHKKTCHKTGLCAFKPCEKQCKQCVRYSCYRICPTYTPYDCQKKERFPYICGNCNRRTYCASEKYSYWANVAQTKYEGELSEARKGISISERQFKQMDELLSPLIKQGQPIYHLYEANKDEIPVSLRTLYHYVRKGYLTAKPIDLPRMLKFKVRRKRDTPRFVNRSRRGRTYTDFLLYCDQHPDIPVVEMDTVKGRREKDPVLLTFFFRQTSLQLAYLLEACTEDCVCAVFADLEETLTPSAFSEMFPLILTDNGPEFRDANRLESGLGSSLRTQIFYCDPMSSWQKGRLEKNHEYLRYLCPKGKSMQGLSPENVEDMVNQINSTLRQSLGGKTPYQLASETYKKERLELLCLKEVPASEVNLSPSLLKK